MNITVVFVVITAVIALFGFSIMLAQWVLSDGDPRQRPLTRPQDEWSNLPTRPYAG